MPARHIFLVCAVLALLPLPAQSEPSIRNTHRFLDGFQDVKVLDGGKDLSAFELETTTGAPLRLGDLKGKWLILNIWATWCAPCIEEMPKLDRLKMMRGSPQFDVLAVSVDLNKSAPRIAYYLKRWKIKYLKALYDDTRKVSKELDTRILPTTYVINPDGKAVAILYGPAHWASEKALSFVDELQNNPGALKRYVKQQNSPRKP
jgi:thiol-disulfide isomerase/thioredoxin